MKSKQAVSLIVLVITIIVMIILVGVIVLSLNNSGIIDKAQIAVDETNLKEVQTLASLKWAEAYIDGNTTQSELQTEVLKRLNEEKIDLTPYEITVTDEGVKVALKKGNDATEQPSETPVEPDSPENSDTPTEPEIPNQPEETENWVVATLDTVPIPKEFVASSATGENTKNGGLVIYEGTTPVTDANVEDAKRTRNQYVWVPVEDFSKFVRRNFGISYTISNTLGSNHWEVVLDKTNMPLSTQNTSYVTSTTLAEVQAMYESVKAYKGFYIARYEAGIDSQRTEDNYKDKDGNIILEGKVYSMMAKIPYTYIPWTSNDSMAEDTNGAVEVARSMYPETNTNYGVVSTLTYGVQWDTTLQWWLDTKAVSSVTSCTQYGNYSDHVISAGDLNDGAKYAVYSTSLGSYQNATYRSTKADGTNWALSTGALKAASVNNIYDMAGNIDEVTMEGKSTTYGEYRALRGGVFYWADDTNFNYVCGRGGTSANTAQPQDGFRIALYIKK